MEMHLNGGETENEFGGDDRAPIFVLVDGTDAAITTVCFGKRLADELQVPWEAIFAETPSEREASALAKAGEALALAGQLGAVVYRLPAATVADALEQHLQPYRAPHVVLHVGPRGFLRRIRRPSLLEELARRDSRVVFHAVVATAGKPVTRIAREAGSIRSYLLAAVGTLLTLAFVLSVNLLTGMSYLSILFLFPVIGAAARLGLRPALLAALLSSIGFNILFLNPLRSFDPWAAQTWVMLAILAAVAVHTSWLTGTLRGRLALSDRSAQESATLAAFAQELTRVADWTSTARVVCVEIGNMLHVKTLLVREVEGELQLVGSDPAGATLDPLDKTALDWAWQHRESTGSGTLVLSQANWQFRPLMTSLGVLAVLGLAREDGRNPVPAEREVLLGTMISQAALAHERLRLEDRARKS